MIMAWNQETKGTAGREMLMTEVRGLEGTWTAGDHRVLEDKDKTEDDLKTGEKIH